MPDRPVEQASRGPYDPSLEPRVSRLEDDMRELKAANSRLEAMVADVLQGVTRIEAMLTATLPHLATKAQVAEILKTLRHFSTKADVAEVKVEMAEMVNAEPRDASSEMPGKACLM